MQRSLILRIQARQNIAECSRLVTESRMRDDCAIRRKEEFTLSLQELRDNCAATESEIQVQINNVKYLTPSKGKKHWLLSHQAGVS